ncbi:MAG: DUF3110 domain-containing protein [Caulobacteraceae bacterium]|nr:DUF3110 domain-containing protein [Caulobacteraceae bacterium]
MFILTILGQEDEGVYSVLNPNGDKIIYIFEEEDDAVRYAMMLEEQDYPEMHVIEVEDEVIIKTCEQYEYNYIVITENDIVIPPKY